MTIKKLVAGEHMITHSFPFVILISAATVVILMALAQASLRQSLVPSQAKAALLPQTGTMGTSPTAVTSSSVKASAKTQLSHSLTSNSPTNGFQSTAEASSLLAVIPIYNNQGISVVKTTLRNYIRPGDIFVLISGNNSNTLDISWLNKNAEILKAQYPDAVIMAGTSGLTNISAAAEGVKDPIEALVYIYEPNFPNEPEFSWDFNKTAANFDKVTKIAHSHGLRSVGKPTGRPILQQCLLKYNWDYGVLGKHVDQMFVQTQTYCKRNGNAFEEAITKIMAQKEVIGSAGNWFPQVTVDPEAPNGVPVERAIRCVKVIESKGLGGVLMWWSPRYTDDAIEFLRFFGR